MSITASSDGAYVATASHDGSVNVWSVQHGDVVLEHEGPDRMLQVSNFAGAVAAETVLYSARLRDPASWLPLAAGASSRNLVFSFWLSDVQSPD